MYSCPTGGGSLSCIPFPHEIVVALMCRTHKFPLLIMEKAIGETHNFLLGDYTLKAGLKGNHLLHFRVNQPYWLKKNHLLLLYKEISFKTLKKTHYSY